VITHQGKLGNEGRQIIHRTSKFKEAMDMAEDKFNQKVKEGYVELESIKKKLGQPSKPKVVPKKKKEEFSKEKVDYNCGSCGKFIPAHIFKKINEWGRTEGGWDKDINFVGYEKVLCMDCQFHYDIFRKKM
jgi:predicted DNA-binding WGR domain protein